SRGLFSCVFFPALFSLASTPEAHSPLARFAALRALQPRLETPDESFAKKIRPAMNRKRDLVRGLFFSSGNIRGTA
ncbi:MAG: hypothetical protein IJC96_03710, partial [Clostridia bacterium]|nr:hypothetical protein [Clostridia bacterium]